jgi:signal recognition particle GTPase
VADDNRRQFLKASAIGVGAVAGFSGTTVAADERDEEQAWKTADDSWDWEKFEAALEDEYGRSEARVAANFAKQQARKVESGKSRDDALEDLREKLLEHPVTDDIEEDIESVREAHREHRERVVSESTASDGGGDE